MSLPVSVPERIFLSVDRWYVCDPPALVVPPVASIHQNRRGVHAHCPGVLCSSLRCAQARPAPPAPRSLSAWRNRAAVCECQGEPSGWCFLAVSRDCIGGSCIGSDPSLPRGCPARAGCRDHPRSDGRGYFSGRSCRPGHGHAAARGRTGTGPPFAALHRQKGNRAQRIYLVRLQQQTLGPREPRRGRAGNARRVAGAPRGGVLAKTGFDVFHVRDGRQRWELCSFHSPVSGVRPNRPAIQSLLCVHEEHVSEQEVGAQERGEQTNSKPRVLKTVEE
mmetsp:Transcript_15084/g.41953  ORF Transcript_15084/g.41953 Transcript_15084/m.41953 type:complete len:277 (-) Transcript_15084:157-987(-)